MIQVTRSVLLSFAHPDDESFMCAGTVAMLADRGVEVTLACATRGEEGQPGNPPLCSKEEVGRMREGELRAACEALGIRKLHLLGYRDRQLAAAPPEEIRAKLVALIRAHRPQIVVTFDPNGANGHADHVAISRFTADAVAAAADARFHPEHGGPHDVARLLWTTPARVYKLARLRDPASEPGIDFLIDIRPWSDRKAAALRAHKTQHVSIDRHFFNEPDCEALLSREAFREAWRVSDAVRPSPDLFDGL